MYVIRDALTSAVGSHKDALAFKNTILRHWPRNGNTFADLIYQTPAGVIKDTAHRKIYHVLGMSIKDMEKNPIDPDKIDYLFIHLNAYSAPNGVVSQTDIRAYINGYSPLIYPTHNDKFNPDPVQVIATDMNTDPNKGTQDAYWDAQGWITVVLHYQPTVLSLVDNGITDAQIIQKVIDISYTDIFYDPMKESRLTALAMMDIPTNSVFQTSLRVISRSTVLKDVMLSANNVGASTGVATQQVRYVNSAALEFKFRRTTDVGVGLTLPANVTSFLYAVELRCNSLPSAISIRNIFGIYDVNAYASLYTGTSTAKSFQRNLSAAVNQQFALLSNWVYPHVDTPLLTVDPSYVNSYYPSTLETNIKVDGMTDLPPKKFKKTFLSLMKFDYKRHEKKGKWYDKFVTIVIIIVAIVIAYFSAGAASGLSAKLIAVSLALGGGAIAVAGWGMYLAKNGGSSGAIRFTMNMSEAIGIASMVAGIGAIWASFAQQSAKQAALEASKKAAVEAVEQGASQAAIDAAAQSVIEAFKQATTTSISSIIGQGISAAASFAGKIGLINDDVAGIAGMIGGSYDSIADIGTTQATSITLDSVMTSIQDGIKQFVTKPLSQILNQTMNWLNAGLNVYLSHISPPNEGLADKAAALAASSKEVETTAPEHIENIWKTYEDPYGSCFETPDTATTCILLTTGLLRSAMNKCYDSGFKI